MKIKYDLDKTHNQNERLKNKELFVEKLEKLSLEYGIWISGCGCCNSPSLWTSSEVKQMNKIEYGMQYQLNDFGQELQIVEK